ncbi:MAG TPA: nif-specific transcriptional activator NifA [Nitrospiria bacterium]|jgi:Nif-specific regulatory protein|nr:nif-specific transcriptional activator NifA [Nitrospiria bacterium]
MKDQTTPRKIAELTALYEISRSLASSMDLQETSRKILEILASVLDMRRGTLTLLDPETGELVIETAHGLTPEEIARGRFKIGEGVTGRVFEKGEPMIVPDVGREPLFLNRTRSRGDLTKERIAFLCMPVKTHGETIGVLSVDRLFKNGSPDLDDDVRVLTVVASLIGQAVKLQHTVSREKRELLEQNIQLQSELKNRYRIGNIVGQSKVMDEVFRSVLQVCKSKATVLLRGESGTGKELIARAIHYNSPRADRPFIKVNCAALPETLLESELFGHERGAFTGATQLRRGRFELADGGTLFLDEIGDIPLSTQVKLLRVLQEQRFERVGGSQTLSVDVRLVAATHRNLEAAIQEGTFREDLYYRLNVVPIFLPSLRERKEDIPLLIEYFLARCNKEHHKQIRIAPDVLRVMIQYHWPGNVRELENCIERMVVMAEASEITFHSMPSSIAAYFRDVREVTRPSPMDRPTLQTTVEDLERQQMLDALKKCGWVQSRAAKILGITPRQIGYKIKKYRIEPG